MAKINLILASKGGVGKTFICNLYSTYLMQNERNPICIDTDPSTPVFSSFPAFNASHFDVIDEKGLIDKSRFDDLIEQLYGLSKDDIVVIDTGASNYLEFVEYIRTANPFAVLIDAGHEIIVHTILCGGGEAETTQSNIFMLFDQFQDMQFVIWENPFHGKLGERVQDKNGAVKEKHFEDGKFFKDNKNKILALVKLPDWSENYHAQHVRDLIKNRKTFLELDGLKIMVANGLQRKWNDVYSIISDAGL